MENSGGEPESHLQIPERINSRQFHKELKEGLKNVNLPTQRNRRSMVKRECHLPQFRLSNLLRRKLHLRPVCHLPRLQVLGRLLPVGLIDMEENVMIFPQA